MTFDHWATDNDENFVSAVVDAAPYIGALGDVWLGSRGRAVAGLGGVDGAGE